MTRTSSDRTAVTLVELLVVLAVLGITAGVVGLTLNTATQVETIDAGHAAIQAARDSAIRTGRTVTVVISDAGAIRPVTADPDGRVIADRTARIDELTGGPDAAH